MGVISNLYPRDLSGTTITDASGEGNNGQVLGGYESSVCSIRTISPDNTIGYISVPDLLSGVSEYSISIRRSSLKAVSWGYEFILSDVSGNNGIALLRSGTTNAFYFMTWVGGSQTATLDGSTGFGLGVENSIIIRHRSSDNQAELYVDGVLVDSKTITFQNTAISRTANYFGAKYNLDSDSESVRFVDFCFSDTYVSTDEIAHAVETGTFTPYYYTSTVTYQSAPKGWKLSLLRDSTRQIVDETTANPTTGSYTLYTPYNEAHTVLLYNEESGQPNAIRSRRMPTGKIGV